MKTLDPQTDLSSLIADLKEEEALNQVSQRIEKGDYPLLLVEECQNGIRLVGERYEQGIYYLSGLIMAGEIMRQVGELVFPLLKSHVSGSESGRILIGTVEGDIHHIGKDIIKVLLQCYGFSVLDIGVDVRPEEFAARVRENRPHIVGLSCLLHSSYNAMRATIELLRAESRPLLSFIIGGFVDEQTRQYSGADAWANDAMIGVRLCQQLIQKHDTSA
jgi:methylmalonyl-CoA mutase cobalamin-binding domain/chain